MSQKEEFKFDIQEPTKAFNKHLNIQFNDRIILSAPFGSGKTYFLKEFFADNDKYEAIHLYPVNYSVAKNEDIFELIKYDILYQLIGKGVEFDEEYFNKLDYLPLFIQDNIGKAVDVFTPLISNIPMIGKSLYNIAENLKKLLKQFEEEFKEINIDDKNSTLEYLEAFTRKTGSIYEEDFYTQLICQLVNQLKNTDEKKETILIIDDLDRIDPDHIFRILNVLSAQIDRDGLENKFNFDRIILVFDQYNVRNIFKNRYGTDVDFTGYIDKFYSYHIYEFSNITGLNKDIKAILKSIKSANNKFDFDKDDVFAEAIVYTFRRLIQANALTVRRLLKVINQTMIYKHNFDSFNNPNVRFRGQFPILFLAELLLFVYEDWDELLYSIKKITGLHFNEDINNRPLIESLISESILLLDRENHNYETSKEQYEYINEEYNLSIKYSIIYYKIERIHYCSLHPKERNSLDDPKLLLTLYFTLKEIGEKKILN